MTEAGTDVMVFDSGKDVAEEPFVCADAGTASCEDAVAFRSPALFSADAGAACPAGYTTVDLVSAAPANANCGCDCTDGGAPTCDTSTAKFQTGMGGCTGGSSGTVTGLSSTCTAVLQGSLGNMVQLSPPGVLGGCSGGTSVPTTATSTNVRLCTPQCPSDESVCTSHAGLAACVIQQGNVGNCPPGYPKGFYVGTSPSVECQTCSCSQSGDCSGSVIHWYPGDPTCSTPGLQATMDGTCQNGNFSFASAKIAPSAVGSPMCNVTPGAASIAYGDAGPTYTVCCP